MDNDIILSPVPFSKLIEALRIVVREEVQAENIAKESSLLITGNEVRSLFKPAITRPTLTRYVRKGLINEKRIGGRIFYSKGEVMTAISKIKKFSPGK